MDSHASELVCHLHRYFILCGVSPNDTVASRFILDHMHAGYASHGGVNHDGDCLDAVGVARNACRTAGVRDPFAANSFAVACATWSWRLLYASQSIDSMRLRSRGSAAPLLLGLDMGFFAAQGALDDGQDGGLALIVLRSALEGGITTLGRQD